MNVVNAARRFFGPALGQQPNPPLVWTEWLEEEPARLYDMLWRYYFNNDLYSSLNGISGRLGAMEEGLVAIRNPAYRVVEFYAAKLWGDELPIETEFDEIREPIERVWGWSNWESRKQVAARFMACTGDLFIKVSQREDRQRVFFQLIDARFVVDFDTDERGFLTYCRIDVPQTRREGDRLKNFTHTEVWTKESYRRWEHDKTSTTEVSELGTPLEELPLNSFGIDFIPIVHAKFRDTGDDRGRGSFLHCLDKIDEANRMATRLHRMLFLHNNAIWAVTQNGVDSAGRPIPPVTLGDGVSVAVGDSRFISLPGGADLKTLVPAINYEGALKILQAHMEEMAQDLPEMAYYSLRDRDLSGRAVRLLLGDAIDRAREARANAEQALVRANQMALTIGAKAKLFDGIGTFEAGKFDHTFTERDILPVSGIDQIEEDKAQAEMLLLRRELGVSEEEALGELGYDEAAIAAMKLQNSERTESVGGAILQGFSSGAVQ